MLGFQKTSFIPEELIPKLKILRRIAKQRSLKGRTDVLEKRDLKYVTGSLASSPGATDGAVEPIPVELGQVAHIEGKPARALALLIPLPDLVI